MQRQLFASWSLKWKLSLMLGAFIGVWIQLEKFGLHMIRYYTTQSNLLVGIFMLYLLYKYWKQGSWSVMDMRLKGGITMVILLTGVVYHLLLRHMAKFEDLWSFDNLLLHYFVPYGAAIDCLLFDKPRCYKWWDPFWWTLFPITYAVSAVVIGVTTRIPIGDNPEGPFPYFFLNVDKLGYGGLFFLSGILAIIFVTSSYNLVLVKHFLGRRKQK